MVLNHSREERFIMEKIFIFPSGIIKQQNTVLITAGEAKAATKPNLVLAGSNPAPIGTSKSKTGS